MNYYEILKVSKNASLEEIKRAKDKLKFGSLEERVPFSMWESIDEAYNVLSNYDSRKAYDLEINNYKEEQKPFYSENIIVEEPADTYSIDIDTLNKDIEYGKDTAIFEKSNDIIDAKTGMTFSPYYSDLSDNKNTQIKESTNNLTVENVFSNTSQESFDISNSEFKNYNNIMIENDEDEDIKYFKKYAKNIEIEIDKLIQKPHNNSRLDLLKLRYINQIDMIERILEMRKNFVGSTSNPITVSLENALNIIKERLPLITDKINKYNNEHEISYLIEQI